MFWFHFYGAIKRDRPMSTEWAREKIVGELNLQDLEPVDPETIHLVRYGASPFCKSLSGGVYQPVT